MPHNDQIPAADASVSAAELNSMRYSMLSLLLAMTLVAVALVLLRYLGIFGLLILLISIIFAEITMRKHKFAGRLAFSRGLWGLVLPLLCIIYDPGILHAGAHINWGDAFAMPLRNLTLTQVVEDSRGMCRLPPVLWQCAGLATWMIGRPWLTPLAAIFCGFFWVGATVAAVIGICLLPISILGLLVVGMGLLGLTPFWTVREYGLAALECRRVSLPLDATELQRTWQLMQEALGVAIAIVVPVVFSCCVLDIGLWRYCSVLAGERF